MIELLSGRIRKNAERAVRAGRLTTTEFKQFMKFYESGLEGYTYLEEP